MSSRDAILGRIRAANASMAVPSAASAYRTGLGLSHADTVALFASRIADYRVAVERVEDEGGIAAAASARLALRGIATLVVPADLPAAWLPPGIVTSRDGDQNPRALDRIAGVMGGCALAIAETGSIVLDAGPRQGRRAMTLLPDYYLCVVLAAQIVGSVPQAIAELAPMVRGARRPITFISGPSATSDIELDRVEGVHGPRTLDVLLVG